MAMYSPQSSHAWLCRFSIRLHELQPQMRWERAVACAVRAYGYASDLCPEAAASVHAKSAMDNEAELRSLTATRTRRLPTAAVRA